MNDCPMCQELRKTIKVLEDHFKSRTEMAEYWWKMAKATKERQPGLPLNAGSPKLQRPNHLKLASN